MEIGRVRQPQKLAVMFNLCLVSRFNQCYGVLGVLDYLHGTDRVFRQSKAYQRHRVLLSLTPLSESIPEVPGRAE